MWIQQSVDQYQQTSRLLDEQKHQTSILLSTVQKLQEEMVQVRSENECFMQKKEMILKRISNKKNQEVLQPILERDTQEENKQ